MFGDLALVVSREVASDPLEVLGRCGLRSPLLVKLSHRRDWRLQRETPLAIWDNLVAPATGFNDLADLQVEFLDCGCHASNGSSAAGCVLQVDRPHPYRGRQLLGQVRSVPTEEALWLWEAFTWAFRWLFAWHFDRLFTIRQDRRGVIRHGCADFGTPEFADISLSDQSLV
jgi:hypothetical protein